MLAAANAGLNGVRATEGEGAAADQQSESGGSLHQGSDPPTAPLEGDGQLGRVHLQQLDWNSEQGIHEAVRNGSGGEGFDVVIGAALLGWVEEASIWTTLATLLNLSGPKNNAEVRSRPSYVVLGASAAQVVVPDDAGFVELGRQSGDLYGMGEHRSSDFEVVVLQSRGSSGSDGGGTRDGSDGRGVSSHTDEL